MISRLIEAILRPVLDLAAHLMTQLFLAPFRALFGLQEPKEAPDEEPEGPDSDPPALEAQEPSSPDEEGPG